MKSKRIIQAGFRHYSRFYQLIMLAILIATAVMVGSLVVGDSVRNSLVKRVHERLGNTETIITTQYSFLDQTILKNPVFGASARGILLSNGFIPSNGKLVPVMVWGVNDMNIPSGSAVANEALFNELKLQASEDIVLRLPAKGLVPSGSLFVTQTYTSSLRLNLSRIISVEEGGNLHLKNEQTIPLNLFVNRDELQQNMDVPDKINLILSDKIIQFDEFKKAWNYGLSGLHINQHKGFSELIFDRVFLSKELVSKVKTRDTSANRMFSYLANGIRLGDSSVPYSFVTACDTFKNIALRKDEIILSDYTAKRLQAVVGDEISISFFVSKDFKSLLTDSVLFKVKQIVPLVELQADTTLSADFPGISDVERCTDWDSDLPINMDLITDVDEAYWKQYRTTPKAILPYETVSSKWGNAYGVATGVRLTASVPDLSFVEPEMFGLRLIYPREESIAAAKNGVDFSGLFIALGIFIIISAVILMVIPLSEMLVQRRKEIRLLQSLGFSVKRIHALLWKESLPVVFMAAVAGVGAGLLYTTVVMWLLGSLWKGATHADGFSVYPNGMTILIGLISGILLSLMVLNRVISTQLKNKQPMNKIRTEKLTVRKVILIVVFVLTLLQAAYNLFVLSSVALFAVVGVMLMVSFALLGDYLIISKGKASTDRFTSTKMIYRTLFAQRKQAMLAYFALAFGIFIIFSVGLNRTGFSDFSRLVNATGGYNLWCESSIPVYHNINTKEGRKKLNLQDLPEHLTVLQCLRYSSDDASCLNLNKVATPSVLGVDMQALLDGPLHIQNSIYTTKGQELIQNFRTTNGKVIPALVDATVLEWSLGKKLGDTLYYSTENAEKIAIVLAGTLPNTIFQGNILIDQQQFSAIWPTIKGSEIMLMKVTPDKIEEVKELVSQSLNEYGMRVTYTSERLKQFNSVTDTYLTIFLSLGGIGLLLGIFAFIIVIRKNLSIRRQEIEHYHTLGFDTTVIKEILYRENRIIPLYAIATGVLSSIIGVGTNLSNVSPGIWITAIVFTLLFIGMTVFFVKRIINKSLCNHNTKTDLNT